MLQQRCARHCLRKAGIAKQQVELAFAGDLQAQCTASNYTMRSWGCLCRAVWCLLHHGGSAVPGGPLRGSWLCA